MKSIYNSITIYKLDSISLSLTTKNNYKFGKVSQGYCCLEIHNFLKEKMGFKKSIMKNSFCKDASFWE